MSALPRALIVLATLLTTATFSAPAPAQEHDDAPSQEHAESHDGDSTALVRELAALRARIARLEAALQLGHRPDQLADQHREEHANRDSKGGQESGPAESSDDARGMGMDMKMGMGRSGNMGGMPGMRGMMGMGPKAKAPDGATTEMRVPTSLPGFPGASHIYHIGATDFFLDHADQIQLTVEQRTALSVQKRDALLKQAESDRLIETREEALWSLTSASTPDFDRIEQEVRVIERLRADKRLAFIQAVGKAAKVLTQEQREVLVGTRPNNQAGQGGGE